MERMISAMLVDCLYRQYENAVKEELINRQIKKRMEWRGYSWFERSTSHVIRYLL
jgi:hypothetical protein